MMSTKRFQKAVTKREALHQKEKDKKKKLNKPDSDDEEILTEEEEEEEWVDTEDDEEDDEDYDEDEEYDEDEDEDEEEEEVKYNLRKSSLRRRRPVIHEVDESDEDDNEMDDKIVKFMKRQTKPKKMEEKKSKKKEEKKPVATSSKKKKHPKRVEVLDEDDEEEEDEYDDEYEEDDEEMGDRKNFIIMLGGGGQGSDDGFYDNYEMAEQAEIEQSLNFDNDECNSEDERTFMKEDYQPSDYPKSLMEEKESMAKRKKEKKRSKTEEVEKMPVPVEEEYRELIDLKRHLLEKLAKSPHSKMLLKTLKECRESISKLVKKSRTKNAKDFYNMIKTETKSATSEIDYFKKKLSHREQKEIMEEMKVINEHINIDKPYRLTLLQTKMPAKHKATVMQKLNVMRMMEPGETEYHKMKTWVDTFMRIPFNVYKNFTVNIKDGVDVCDKFMRDAKQQLDDCVYGLEDAKLQILQMMGQWVTNPDAMGSAIAICGPPGTGKTSIAKEGISKILGREFAFMALGGAGDASVLEGHSYTYEGSMWGRIVQFLIDSKCMNPVIYFDELDKISDSARGQEIVGILTHLTDKSQNSQFHDKYFSEVDFDLSKCLFIFSYNDENLVNPILKDRMYRIKTKGYDAKDKVIIAKKYMLPKIREQVNFEEGDIVIPDDVLQYIISTPKFTQNEQGVRNLNRCLEIIHTKLNLFRLMRMEDNSMSILGKDVKMTVTFPYTVTKKDVDVLIHSDDNQNQSMLAMYV